LAGEWSGSSCPGKVSLVSSCEYGDESSGSGATELVSQLVRSRQNNNDNYYYYYYYNYYYYYYYYYNYNVVTM
jgi:hypothetical protein